jgi:hypothetical protein
MPATATPEDTAFRSPVPLRGRDEELERVGERISDARSSIGSVVTVAGDPGLGKTRLLEEAAQIARRIGVRFAYAAADPSESVVPFSSLMTALFDGDDPLVDRSALKELRALPGRYWLIQELGMLLEDAALSAPLCVCLDDLQWADGATVAALRVLPARLASMPIVWVGAWRPGQASPELRAALAELDELGADRIKLQPLDDVAVTQIVMDIVGAEPSLDLLEVTESAKGVPFFLEELLFGLLEEGLIRVENGEARLVEARLPARFRESMLQRLDRLSDSARRTALVASVLGRDFGFEDLALMREVSPGALLDPVEELTRADILIETPTGLRFRHDITRQAVQDSVPGSARRALERQAVAVLLGAGALPVEVAAQLAASAEPGDEAAANTLRQAAHGLASSDPGVAAGLSQKALEVTPQDGSGQTALIAETALLLHAAGRAEEGRRSSIAHCEARLLRRTRRSSVCRSRGCWRSLPMSARTRTTWRWPSPTCRCGFARSICRAAFITCWRPGATMRPAPRFPRRPRPSIVPVTRTPPLRLSSRKVRSPTTRVSSSPRSA